MEGLGRLQEVIARARTRCVFSQQNTHSNRIFFIRGLVRPSDRRALARQPESNSTITHRLPACPPQGISSCSACFPLPAAAGDRVSLDQTVVFLRTKSFSVQNEGDPAWRSLAPRPFVLSRRRVCPKGSSSKFGT